MALWYLSRATGAATLVLLTLTLVLGVVNVERFTSRHFPRFVVDGWHRGVSLIACVLLALHIVTTLFDSYAPIRLVDVFVPFTGSYRPLWLGLGALALDLLIAVTVTSLLRSHIGVRTWRAVHWAAYACWPVALMHGLGTGSDVKAGWLAWTALACGVAVALAILVRLAGDEASAGVRAGAVAALLAGVIGLGVWLPSGPLASGWAAKAGTPASLL
ncbi:MAG: methionine sulfoxide reductase heme-binding subunit, partial [Thermoleophilaceae bacterium]|nr:methionine sulfoxide reductase heme-binding subunit [Thermoleophilaceae bacterium]